jgi:hypothetical protein
MSKVKDDLMILDVKVDRLDTKTTLMNKKIDGLYDENNNLRNSIDLNSRYIHHAFEKIS